MYLQAHEVAGHVVVGFDASDSARVAVEWAAAEAARRQVPLTVLNALDVAGLMFAPGMLLPWAMEELDEYWRRVADEGVQRAVAAQPGVTVTGRTVLGPPGAVLVEAGDSAALLVVGSRGHGPLVGALLGSVAFTTSAHARCPVAVVRGEQPQPPGPHHPVLVAVDDSTGSHEALRMAAELAAQSSARLRVVCVWRPTAAEEFERAYGLQVPPDQDWPAGAQRAAEAAVQRAAHRAMAEHPGLAVETLAVPGPVAAELGKQARGAGLLVVGARGHGGFPGLRLGSVSRAVIHEVDCPVLVVHAPPED